MLDLVLSSHDAAAAAPVRRHDPRFVAAYARYRGLVRGSLAQLGVAEADRDDLVQEVFFVLLRHLGRLADDGEIPSLRAWMYQTARRVAANHRRKLRRREQREDAIAELLDGSDPGGREAVLDATLLLARFLDGLDEDARTVFLLSEVDGRTGPEIAERLGIKVNTAYSRVRSVRARLRDEVHDERHSGWLALLPGVMSRPSPLAATFASLVAIAALRIGVRKGWLAVAAALLAVPLLWLGLGRGLRPDRDVPLPVPADDATASRRVDDPGDDEADVHTPMLRGTAALVGRVTDPHDAPVPGSRVCIEPRQPTLELRVPHCVGADAHGNFAIRRLAAGLYAVTAAAPDHIEIVLAEAQHRMRLAPGQQRGGIELRLRPGGSWVRGTVVDVTGGAIEGALVRPGSIFTATFTRSDANGRFALWMDGHTSELVAQAEGYAPGSVTTTNTGTRELELELTPEATIEGIVRDEASGRPVAGVAVMADAPSMSGISATADERAAISDVAGRFHLRALPPGRHHPTVQSGEWFGLAVRPVLLAIGEGERDVEVLVRAARRVHGTVQWTDGAPCGGARIAVRDAADEAIDSSRTDAAGEVEIGGLPPMPVRLSIACDSALPLEVELDLEAGSALGRRWIVTRRPGVMVRGRLLDPEGRGVALTKVMLVRDEIADNGARVSGYGNTDDDGSFELGPVPPGRYGASIDDDHGFTRTPVPAAIVVGDEALAVDLRASRSARLRVRTLDAAGAPVPGVEVLFRGAHGGTYRISGADGVALLDLPPGRHHLREGAPGEAGKPMSPAAFEHALAVDIEGTGEHEVVLTVARRDGTLRGRVVDEDGASIGDARIDVQTADAMPDWFGAPKRQRVHRGWADDAGNFAIDHLLAGRYAITAATPGGVAGAAVIADTGEVVTVVLPRSGSLCGTVALDGGDPPRQFRIAVRTSDERSVRQRFVADDGRWCVEDLARGTATVEASTVAGTATATALVPDGGVTDGVALRILARGRAKGRIVDPEGTPVRGAFIALSSSAGGLHSSADGEQRRSDADGTFEVPGPAGGIEIVVLAPAGFETRKLTGELASGELTDLGDIALARRR